MEQLLQTMKIKKEFVTTLMMSASVNIRQISDSDFFFLKYEQM